MREYITEVDEGFLFTPEVQGIFSYHKDWNSMEEIQMDPDYYSDILGGYRIFEVEYLGKKGFIPFITKIEFDGGFYKETVEGVRTEYNVKPIIESCVKAMGILLGEGEAAAAQSMLDDFTDYVFEKITPDVPYYDELSVIFDPNLYSIKGLISKNMSQEFYDKMMYHIYSCLYHYFGPDNTGTEVSNPYTIMKRHEPEGQRVISDINHDDVINNICAYNFENNQFSTLSATDFNELLTDIVNNDEFTKNMFDTADNIRVMGGWGNFPGHKQMWIAGWDVINNDVVVTNEGDSNQHYGVSVEKMKRIKMVSYDDGATYEITERGETEGTTYSATIYNYRTSVSGLNVFGIPHGGGTTVGTSYITDSMGATSSSHKRIATSGRTPTSEPMDEVYPDWKPEEPITIHITYPVGGDDPVNPFNPSYIRRGIPTPGKPIKIQPVPGLPPYRPVDIVPVPTRPTADEAEIVGTGIYSVWKMTNAQLRQLGGWLWQEDGLNIEKISQVFKNNPMDALISLHQIYTPVKAGDNNYIKLGHVVTNVSGAPVTDRYQELSLGTIDLDRYFNDIRDYQTRVSIYIPFVGITELNVNDVMDSNIRCDVIADIHTGDCLITLGAKRHGGDEYKTLYVFNSNCATQLPLTGSDKTRLYSNIANMAAKGIGTVGNLVTGNFAGAATSAIGLVGSAADTALTHNISISKSGSISGNSGAMGYKKPYLIIERPTAYDAVDKNKYIGNPSNTSVHIGDISGYSVFNGVHVDTISNASDEEKNEIYSYLTSGVIL